MFGVKKSITFRSGHRLLSPYEGRCSNIHGEFFTAAFYFESEILDDKGMVVDFSLLKKKLKTWIDENLDHAYICRNDDPVISTLEQLDLRIYKMVVNPTSENIAHLLFNVAKSLNFPITRVEVVESDPDSVAWFQGPA